MLESSWKDAYQKAIRPRPILLSQSFQLSKPDLLYKQLAADAITFRRQMCTLLHIIRMVC